MKKLLRIAITLVFCTVISLCLSAAAWAENGDYILPANTTVIEDEAFSGCAWMKTVTIPAGVTSIGKGAFEGCTGLTDVYFGGTQAQWAAVEIGSDNERLTGVSIHCVVVSGKWGDITWTLYSNGLLTISCSGDMPDFDLFSTEAWLPCNSIIKKAVIYSGVTHIGSFAFRYCSNLESVAIPSSVTSIGFSAFNGCTSLTNITIPSGVMSIGNSVFENCSGLTSVLLPSSLRSIGDSAFFSCNSLTNLTVPEGVTSIGICAFIGCSNLTDVMIPSSVTSIGLGAFNRCGSLINISVDAKNSAYCDVNGILFDKNKSEILCYPSGRQGAYSIPASVTSIGPNAFSESIGLTSITIPTSVTSIGNSAFEKCSSLTSIIIPANVTSIGTGSFSYCSSLTNMTIPSGLTSISNTTFSFCSGLTSVTIPSSVTSIGTYAFFGTGLNDIYYSGTQAQWNSVTIGSDNERLTGATLHCIVASGTWGDLSWTLDNAGLLVISGTGDMNNFNNNSEEAWHLYKNDIISVAIQSGVTSIGINAFLGCVNLTSVSIPESVTRILNNEFVGCSSLTSIRVDPKNENYCDQNGVLFDKGMTCLTCCPGGVSGNYAIPQGVTSIDGSAFEGCSKLTNVTIPESVTSIGYSAFNGCTSLTSVNIPEGVTYLGSYAFDSCSSLTSVTILGSVTNIGRSTFSGCTKLERILLPLGLTSIGEFAFKNCSSLGRVTIPNSVTTIKWDAFHHCDSLNEVILPDSLTSIGENAFAYCGELESVNIPRNLLSIGKAAFGYCSSLSSEIVIPGSLVSITEYAFYGCSSLRNVTIEEGTTSIGQYAFRGCSNLTNISIPKSITSIDDYAFYGCKCLTGVTIQECEVRIGDYAFYNCSGLLNVTIEGGATTIGVSAFERCSKLKSVLIQEGVVNIRSSAFRDCSSLTSVTIPGSVTSIGSSAFCNCSALTSATLEDGVTSIGGSAFSGCSAMTSVAIPESMESIGNYAFNNCSNLCDVYYTGSEQQWNTLQSNLGYSNTPLLNAKKHYYSEGLEDYSFISSGVLCSGEGWSVNWEVLYYKPFTNTIDNVFLNIYLEGAAGSSAPIALYSELEDGTVMPWLTVFQKTDFEKICIQGSIANPLEVITDQFSGYSNVQTVQLTSVSTLQAGAFSECTSLETLQYDGLLRLIGARAFRNDTKLSKLQNNSHNNYFETIGDEAFMNTGLQSFAFDNMLNTIGARAFQDTLLARAVIGKNVAIGENAFTNHEGFVIICYRDSEAHQYAQREGIDYLLMDMDIPISFNGYNARFSNSYFSNANPSTVSNRDLSLLSGILSWAVYNDSGKPSMRSVLNDIGIQSDDIYEASTKNYRYTIAKREIFVDGEITNLLIVSMKGTNQLEEVLADHFTRADSFFFGYNAYDIIFDFEKDRVMAGLNAYRDMHPEIMEMPLKVLITGHSLGGATANLLGARFTKFSDGDDASWWAPLLTKNDIYVYTFASIDSIQTDQVVAAGYENIHNIYNYHDSYGPHGWPELVSAAGRSGHGKFGHIDLFYSDVDQGAFGANQNHMMGVYLDAVVNNKVKYEHPFAEALLNDELVA